MKIEDVLARIDSLPPMPAVAVRLLEAAQDPDAQLDQVAGWIERDAAMTANLLRLCNSPFYGLRREVTSVRQATGLLGLKKIIQIALTVLAARYLTPSQEGYDLRNGELWRSSVASAIAAELIAEQANYPNVSTAYTAGLLQDVGKIVLADFVGGVLPQIRERIDRDNLPWEQAERQVVGITHPEVGAILLARWGFPKSLVESVRYHHKPGAAELDLRLSQISHLADALAMTLGMGLGADGLAYELDETTLLELGIGSREAMDQLLATLAQRIAQADDFLRPPAAD